MKKSNTLLLVLVLIISLSACAQPAADEATEQPAKVEQVQSNQSKNDGFISSGEYIVGQDIPAGEYIFMLEDFNDYEGSLLEILDIHTDEDPCECGGLIYSNEYDGFDIVTLEENSILYLNKYKAQLFSDYLSTTPDLITISNHPGPNYDGGIFHIGTMIEPGAYLITPLGEYSFYGVRTNTRPLMDTYIISELNGEEQVIQLPEGSFFQYRYCSVEPTGASQVQQQTNINPYSGYYIGSYTNKSGPMLLEIFLIITDLNAPGANTWGYVEFWPAESNSEGKHGLYEVEGYIDIDTGFVDMKGTKWGEFYEIPSGYNMLDFSGVVQDGIFYGIWDRAYMQEFELYLSDKW